jgi:hypothetical protein
MDQAAPSHPALLRHLGKRRANANLDCHQRLCARDDHQEASRLDASLNTLLQILSLTLFEKLPLHQALAGVDQIANDPNLYNQLKLFDF